MTHPVPLILVVDDDPAIRKSLCEELQVHGYATVAAADGIAAQAVWQVSPPDLVITDLAMPRADGFELIRALRGLGSIPVIVLSVRGDEEDKVRALDLGADDYVSKPFSLKELLARTRAQLRRQGAASEGALEFSGLTLDRERRRVLVDGQDVRLTPTEFAILDVLATNAGKPVTLRQLIARVWRGAPATTPDTVRVHVSALRRKIEPEPGNPRYIATEPWVGYRFLAEPRGA
jgi:two-component system KDP operon response regulator KdpE